MVSVKELKRADLFFHPLKNIQKLKSTKSYKKILQYLLTTLLNCLYFAMFLIFLQRDRLLEIQLKTSHFLPSTILKWMRTLPMTVFTL